MSEYISKRVQEEEQRIARERFLEWARNNEACAFMEHNAKSVELIRYSARRGMSRSRMNQIWGERLVSASLGS